jgi:hypothetical protein
MKGRESMYSSKTAKYLSFCSTNNLSIRTFSSWFTVRKYFFQFIQHHPSQRFPATCAANSLQVFH